MKTTARVLTHSSPLTLGIQSMNLIKSRINCNAGFAWNLMEKYHLSDSDFPPAYFVFFENGQEAKTQDEKGRILNLLLQLLHYENNSQNVLFQNMIFNNIKEEVEFRLEQMKQTSAKDYKDFFKLFKNTVSFANTEIQSELYRAEDKSDKSVWETKTSEQNVNITAVEKSLYEIEGNHTIFPVLTLQEHQSAGTELVSSENKKLSRTMDNEKEHETRQQELLQERQEAHRRGDDRTEELEFVAQHSGRKDREQEKKLLEKQLQKQKRKIHEVDYLPSVRAQKVLQYLETITEGQQHYMAFILGIERSELLEQLRHMDNRGWDALETDIDRCMEAWNESEPEEADLNQSEAFQDNIVASGLLQWKYKLGEWVGFLETKTWNHLTNIVSEHEDALPLPMSKLFNERDKAAVLSYFEQTESMEELFPLIHLVYRDVGLQEAAAGWLPGMEQLIERKRLMKQADEEWILADAKKKEQLLRHWAELLEDEEWQHIKLKSFSLKEAETEAEERESYILWLTQLPIARRERILAPAAEILYGSRRMGTAHILQEEEDQNPVSILKKEIQTNEIQNKIRILEKQSWNEVKDVIFAATQRDVFLESLNSETNLETAVSILRREQRIFFGERIKVASPEKTLISEKTLTSEYRQAYGLLKWKHCLEEWIGFLEMDTWELLTDVVAENEDRLISELRSCFMTKDKRTVLTYVEQTESIEELLPFFQLVHEDVRLRNEVRGWFPDIERLTKCQELMYQADEAVTFMDMEQKKSLVQRWIHLLDEDEWSFTEKESLFQTESGEIERGVYLSWMEQLSHEQMEQLLIPTAAILYRKQGAETERNQEERQIEAEDEILLLQEEIRSGTIQKRLRSLENQNWKQIVELTSDVIHREVFLQRLEQLSAEEKKLILAPAAEVLYRRQGRVIKDQQQEITEERTERSEQEMLWEDIRKNEIQRRIRTLERQNWEEMKTLTSFAVTKEQFLKQIEQLNSPEEIETVTHNLQTTQQVEETVTFMDMEQKKSLVQRWIHLLEEDEWSFTEKENLSHTESGEIEREVYLRWMEQLSHEQMEQLLIPAAEILYRKQGAETERNQEGRQIEAEDEILLLQEEIRSGTIQKRLRSLENQNWKQIVEFTSDVIHREVFLQHLEQLSAEEKKLILAPAAEILYRRQDRVIEDQQQEITEERTERSEQEMLWEDIRKNEIQRRIRTLERKNWEEIKTITSFAVTKELFLKQIEQLNSPKEIETVIHNLQMTHRIFYREPIQKDELTKKKMRTEHWSEEYRPETIEHQEVRLRYRQAVRQWNDIIGIRRQSISEQRSFRENSPGRTIQTKPVWENPEMEYDTGIYLEVRKPSDTSVLLPRMGKKEVKNFGDRLKVWSPNGLQEGETANMNFFYEAAQMITSRSSGRQTKEMQVTPTIDVENIVSRVKTEAINDIQIVKRQHTIQETENQNSGQFTNLLKQLSSQQKEMEQLKQVQARLIQSTDMGKITETVMKQFKTQLRTEKLRRGL